LSIFEGHANKENSSRSTGWENTSNVFKTHGIAARHIEFGSIGAEGRHAGKRKTSTSTPTPTPNEEQEAKFILLVSISRR
jgi:hypothetical protein